MTENLNADGITSVSAGNLAPLAKTSIALLLGAAIDHAPPLSVRNMH